MKASLFVSLAVIALIPASLVGQVIQGKIVQVQGDTFTLKLDSDRRPQVQDKVEIFVEVPGVGQAVVATAVVTEVAPASVRAKLERATGRVQAGQRIVIRQSATVPAKSLVDDVPARPVDDVDPVPPEPENGSSARPPGDTGDPIETRLNGFSSQDQRAVREAAKLIPRYHFSGRPFDDMIAGRLPILFPNALDPYRLYLEKRDVDQFRSKVGRFVDEFRRGKVTSFYDLTVAYVKRVHQRIAWVDQLLEENFDYSVDESLIIDPEGDFLTESELRDQWRKNVKRELLVHLDSGVELQEAKHITRKRFRNRLIQARQLTGSDVASMAIDQLISAYDPQSSYLSPKQVENFYISQQKKLEGIGASLQLVDGYVTIAKIISGGPAAQDGRLKEGDRITAVAQGETGEFEDVVMVRLENAVELIRGKAGTTVRLRVISKDQFESQIYDIERGVVRLTDALQSVIVAPEHLPDNRQAKIGLIKCAYFYQDLRNKQDPYRASVDMKKVLDEFRKQNVELLLLDLRSNSGGPLNEVFSVAGLFLGDLPATQTRDSQGKIETYTTQVKQMAWTGPLMVLTNRYSSSGAELLVGALKDHSRCLVVGDETTFGSGLSQNLVNIKKVVEESSANSSDSLPNLGMLKITTHRFYSPSGTSPQKIGVTSDLSLPSLTNVYLDPFKLPKFDLDSDTIRPAKISDSGMMDDKLRQILTKLSKSRVSSSEYFRTKQVEIDEYLAKQKAAAGKSVYPLQRKPDGAGPELPDAPDESEEDAVVLIEDPEVVVDGYLTEVFHIGLDYLARLSYRNAEKDYKARNYANAVTSYRRALEADPDFTQGHYKLGWFLATTTIKDLKDPQQAVKYCESACRLDQFQKWYYVFALAVAHSEAGDFDAALKHLQDALARAPEEKAAKYRNLESKFKSGKPFSAK